MHQLGNGVQNLLIASAAAGAAVGNFLNMGKGLIHVSKGLIVVKCIFNIKKAYLLTIANHVVFHKILPVMFSKSGGI